MRNALLLLAAGLVAGAAPAYAQTFTPAPKVAPARLAAQKAILASGQFRVASASLERDWDRIVADIVTLTEIEAPPFQEEARGKAFAQMLKAAGMAEVVTDRAGNVYGVRKGTGGGPLLVVTAHLDTVFPAGTDVKVRREGDRLSAPGIGDDTASLPVILAYVRALDAAKITTKSDIVFMGNVGEEGPGDLRGMRHLFGEGPLAGKVGYFISLEPGSDRITTGGVGSKRYRLTYKGPGGHSYGAFGMVNPAYALGGFLSEFGKTKVPASPKTTFGVGVLEGGTSVNSIPFAVSAEIDMRSEGKAELAALEAHYLSLPQPAADAENAARSTTAGRISVENKPIGDRPVGRTADSADIVQIAVASMQAGGVDSRLGYGSTDSNWPMSLGVQAITLGSGFESERAHSLDESLVLDKDKALKFMRLNLATILGLAGASLR